MGRKIRQEDSLLSAERELVGKEWCCPFNDVLGIDPGSVSVKCTKTAYWRCPVCGSLYRMPPAKRLEHRARGWEPCFSCSGKVQLRPFTVPL